MTNEEIKRTLQGQVQHNRITAKGLGEECEKWNLLLHEDVLEPIGYNTCDRCGNYGDSELDFLWVDGFEWDNDNLEDQAILRNIDREGIDYDALCWGCVS